MKKILSMLLALVLLLALLPRAGSAEAEAASLSSGLGKTLSGPESGGSLRIGGHDVIYRTRELYACWDQLPGSVVQSRVLCYPAPGEEMRLYTVDSSRYYLNNVYLRDLQRRKLYDKPRVLIVAGVHGNERIAPLGLLCAFETLLQDPAYSDILSSAVWDIVPVANPWGFDHSYQNESGQMVFSTTSNPPSTWTVVENSQDQGMGLRRNADGIDINRDYNDDGGFQTEEARAIRGLLEQNHYDLVLDLHQASVGDARNMTDGAKKVVGFLSMSNQPASMSEEEYELYRNRLYWHMDRVNFAMEQLCAQGFLDMDYPAGEHFLIWDGTANMTLRNYAGGAGGNKNNLAHAVTYSVCMETSIFAAPFTDDSSIFSETSRDITCNYILEFLREAVLLLEP